MAGRQRGNNSDPRPSVKLSKSLSWLLRHGAEKEGFKFLLGGFLYVDDILKHPKYRGTSLDDITQMVESNDKKRFALEEDTETGKLKIRANQGHSLEVPDLDLKPIIDATEYPIVIHGTNHRAYNLIAKQGLKPMTRTHVHFAAGEPGENGVISGMRNSCTVVIYLNLQKAIEDGLKFYLSANNVILSPGNDDKVIPPDYFKKVLDRNTGQKLPHYCSALKSEEMHQNEDGNAMVCTSATAGAVTAEEISDEYDKKKKRKEKKNKRKTDA